MKNTITLSAHGSTPDQALGLLAEKKNDLPGDWVGFNDSPIVVGDDIYGYAATAVYIIYGAESDIKLATVFVLSTDGPMKIVNNLSVAFVSGYEYIDAFTKEGNHLHAWRQMNDGSYSNDA